MSAEFSAAQLIGVSHFPAAWQLPLLKVRFLSLFEILGGNLYFTHLVAGHVWMGGAFGSNCVNYVLLADDSARLCSHHRQQSHVETRVLDLFRRRHRLCLDRHAIAGMRAVVCDHVWFGDCLSSQPLRVGRVGVLCRLHVQLPSVPNVLH